MGRQAGKVMPYIVLGLSFCLLLFLNIFYHDNWLDSDMAAEMIFSKLLSEEGHFFATPDWYYSTEFRFLYTHWIMGPLFHVFQSWHVIRAITNILSYLLMLGAYYFCVRPLRLKRETVVATSAILLLPFSETMMTHMVMGNTYLFHVMISFWYLGAFLRLAFREQNRYARIGWWGLYGVLSVICGLSGVRYLLALQGPVVLTGFIWLAISGEGAAFRQKLKADNWKSEGGELLHSVPFRTFCYGIAGVVMSVAGYAVNVLYVSKKYVFQTYGSTNFIAVYQGVFLERLQNAFGSLLMLFGYIPDKSVLSLRGMITLIAFVLIGLFSLVTVLTVREGRRKLVQEQAASDDKGATHSRWFMTVFFPVAFALNVFVFVFTTSTMVPRYYLTVYIFFLPVLCIYMDGERLLFDKLAVAAVLCVCLLGATGKTTFSYISTDKNAEHRKVARFLTENDYRFGYATYWNANILTELTNGKVEVANVLDAETLTYFKWSSPKKYYEEVYGAGRVFLLLEKEEAVDCETVRTGTLVYDQAGFQVYSFDSRKELMDCVKGKD